MRNCENSRCPYDLWAPNDRSKVENVAFSAYAFHQQNIEDFINELAASPDPNDPDIQAAVANSVNLSFNSLTSYDIEYIEREVNKRL